MDVSFYGYFEKNVLQILHFLQKTMDFCLQNLQSFILYWLIVIGYPLFVTDY